MQILPILPQPARLAVDLVAPEADDLPRARRAVGQEGDGVLRAEGQPGLRKSKITTRGGWAGHFSGSQLTYPSSTQISIFFTT